jgi:hypothetical protein
MDGLEFTPYTRIDGIPLHRDSYLKGLYERLVESGTHELLFHDGQIQNDLDFIAMVKDMSKTVWFEMKVFDETIGMFWLNRIEKTHAYCHFMAYPEYWGRKDLVLMGQEAMRMVLGIVPMIMGMIPSWNTHAIDYLKKVGLQDGGTFPFLIWSAKDNKPVEGKILYITQEDLT